MAVVFLGAARWPRSSRWAVRYPTDAVLYAMVAWAERRGTRWNQVAVAARLGVNPVVVKRSADRLRQRGLLIEHNRGRGSRSAWYALAVCA